MVSNIFENLKRTCLLLLPILVPRLRILYDQQFHRDAKIITVSKPTIVLKFSFNLILTSAINPSIRGHGLIFQVNKEKRVPSDSSKILVEVANMGRTGIDVTLYFPKRSAKPSAATTAQNFEFAYNWTPSCMKKAFSLRSPFTVSALALSM